MLNITKIKTRQTFLLMKKLIFILPLLLILFSNQFIQAHSKVKVPEKLHGFWHFDVTNTGDWDGTLIGSDYVEFFYKLYYIDKIEEQGADGYRLWLRHEDGNTLELTISELNNKQAKLQFFGWDAPKVCQLLDKPTDTEFITTGKLPKSIFREWSSDGKGTVSCKFHNTNKLLYQNKEWAILSVGYYLKKEYRMLIRSGDLYKLIYIDNLSNQSLRLVCNMKAELLSPVAANKDIYKVLGNWAQKSSNAWQLGFFESFAVYNGDFWDYGSVDINGSTGNVVLKKGPKRTKIELLLTSDELCEIAIDGKPMSTYFKCGKNLPAYTTTDTISFKDTRFQKVDTVTIRGYLRNNPGNKPFSVSYIDPIKNQQVEFFSDVDSLGRFTIKFPLINTSHLFLDWGRMTKMDVAEPGETYFLLFDFSTDQYLITGDNARFHNELAGYDRFDPNEGISRDEYMKRRSMPSMEYLSLQKENLRKSNEHLNDYIGNHPLLSERFKYFQKNYYRFEVASNLMQRRFNLDRNKSERFPGGFMDYIDDTLYQNQPARPYTLVREYLSFMTDYIGYKGSIKGLKFVSVSSSEALLLLQNDGRLKLTDEEKKLVSLSEEYIKVISKLQSEKADSTKIAEALIPFREVNKKLKQIYERDVVKNFLKDEWPNIATAILDKRVLDRDLVEIDSLITDPELKELFEVQKFYQLLDLKKTALPVYAYGQFKERIKIPVLAESIEKLQNHYSQLSKQDIEYTESLKNTDHLKESKDADALFAGLIKPYKGKVIYIDFWGTWCGPCKGELPFVGAVKEALKDKDVIFMYFANNSPEDSWKNVIKENHLTGENVVHYRLPDAQQAMIERRMTVRSFPTYILMDKLGNIVNMKAPRPSQKDQLVKEITKLLN